MVPEEDLQVPHGQVVIDLEYGGVGEGVRDGGLVRREPNLGVRVADEADELYPRRQ